MPLSLRQLSYFAMVADLENLTLAATELHVAQPSLSVQIRLMEREVGVALFERLPRGVALTPAGRELLPIARQILGDAERLHRVARELADTDGGTLRIGATPSASAVLAPEATARFHSAYPNVTLEFTEGGSEDLVRLLETDDLDVAIVNLPVSSPSVTVDPLTTEQLVLAVRAGHPLSGQERVEIAALREVALVLPRAGYSVRTAALAACRRARFTPRVVASGGELSGVLGLVARGVGAAIVPASVASATPGVVAIPIAHPPLTRTIALARRSGSRGRSTVDGFVHAVHDAVRAQRAPEHRAHAG